MTWSARMVTCWPQDSSMRTDGSHQQALSEDSEVILLLKLVPQEAWEQEHILGPYLEELFDAAPPKEWPTMESGAYGEGTEATPEPSEFLVSY